MSTNESLRSRPSGPLDSFEPTRWITAEGFRWRVFELSDPQSMQTAPSLIFEHELAWRRVRRFPANWYELADAELVALLSAT